MPYELQYTRGPKWCQVSVSHRGQLATKKSYRSYPLGCIRDPAFELGLWTVTFHDEMLTTATPGVDKACTLQFCHTFVVLCM